MSDKKQYPKPIGAMWIKDGNYGQYMSISIEINGVKHSFVAYANKFYEEGSNKPQWNIQPPKQPQEPSKQVDKYQTQLDSIMAQKAAREKIKVLPKSVGEMMEEAGLLTEQDVPF